MTDFTVVGSATAEVSADGEVKLVDQAWVNPPVKEERPDDQLTIERRKLKILRYQASRWMSLNETFCNAVRQADSQKNVGICEEGLEEFCEEIGVDFHPLRQSYMFKFEVEVTVAPDDADDRAREVVSAIESLANDDSDWVDGCELENINYSCDAY